MTTRSLQSADHESILHETCTGEATGSGPGFRLPASGSRSAVPVSGWEQMTPALKTVFLNYEFFFICTARNGVQEWVEERSFNFSVKYSHGEREHTNFENSDQRINPELYQYSSDKIPKSLI